MEDDLTPNDSEALGVYIADEPEEVEQEDRVEENRIAIAAAVADDIITWFDKTLAEYETIDAVKKTMNTHKNLSLEAAFAAHYQISLELNKILVKFRGRFTKPGEDENG